MKKDANFLLPDEASERLWYRKVKWSDFDDWLPFYNHPESTRYWEGLPPDPSEACQQQFDRIFERYQKHLGGMNALISKASGNLIGLCGLLVQQVDAIEELEIGYSILPQYWGKGYATEAAQKCTAFAKQHLLAATLISIIHVDNLPSQKVAINVGMQLEKTTSYKNNPVHIFRVKL
ncbi:MAG: GNAT family N-acetyltransferase [Bacteroidota bacterium]